MTILPKVSASLHALLGTMAEEVNRTHPVVRRRRKFTPATLAQTFLLGFLAKPRASDAELARMAVQRGFKVTAQAIEQRHSAAAADFFEALFRRATQEVVRSRPALAPLLRRFAAVLILDSTAITLPDALRTRFPGCGGSHGNNQAALKFQVQWDLVLGGLDAIAVEPGRDCDNKTTLQQAPLPPGSLRITDLGYFDTEVFERLDRDGVYWLSRLQFGLKVFAPEGTPLNLLRWLEGQDGPVVDRTALIGAGRKMACRLMAWRVPSEVANRRRQKLIAAAWKKEGRVPGADRLAWCDWTILVTNVPEAMISVNEAAVLYRARWQIELLFKRWKSLGLVADLGGGSLERRMVRFWSRLLAALVQHWLALTGTWGDARFSLTKAWTVIQEHVMLLATALDNPERLEEAVARLAGVLEVAAVRYKRKIPNTFELLNDPNRLAYGLT